jgi:PhnB protein
MRADVRAGNRPNGRARSCKGRSDEAQYRLNHPLKEPHMAKVKPIPEGHNSVSPYLIVDGAERALDFYKKAFGATELFRHGGPDGKIGHAEVRIGDTVVMLADVHPEFDANGPRHFGGSPVSLHLYVEDVDAVAGRAIAAGAKVKRPVADQFYGDRLGTLEDPFGHTWHVSTHIEDVSAEELGRRAAAAMQDRKKSS